MPGHAHLFLVLALQDMDDYTERPRGCAFSGVLLTIVPVDKRRLPVCTLQVKSLVTTEAQCTSGCIGYYRGPTPEWVGWTVTGPSPAEGHLPWPGVSLVGELAQVPHYPER